VLVDGQPSIPRATLVENVENVLQSVVDVVEAQCPSFKIEPSSTSSLSVSSYATFPSPFPRGIENHFSPGIAWQFIGRNSEPKFQWAFGRVTFDFCRIAGEYTDQFDWVGKKISCRVVR
jgi:hypothetical protein